MLHVWPFLPVAALVLTVQAKPLGPTDSQSIALSSQSSAATNISVSELEIECDEGYGENIDVKDCENAISHMRLSDKDIEFWNLHRDDPDKPEKAKGLPFRLMGGMLPPRLIPIL